MERNIKDTFFTPINFQGKVKEEEYRLIQESINILDALSRSSSLSIYIIDYYKQNFLYVSSAPLFLNGYSEDEIREMGYSYYEKFVPAEDLRFLQMVNKIGFEFFYRIPYEERLKYTISYNFHIINKHRKKIFINHKLTPIKLNSQHQIWLALCIVSLAPKKSNNEIIVNKLGSSLRYIFDKEEKIWIKDKVIQLTEQQISILRLSAQGYSNLEVSKALYCDINTIKFHKKQIYSLFGVHTLAQALRYATINKLI